MYIKKWIRSTLKFILYILLIFWVLWMFSSCKTKHIIQEVPVEVHDTTYKTSIQCKIDTLWKRDSISIIDTMWIDASTIATLGMPTLHHNRTTSTNSDKGKVTIKLKVDTFTQVKEIPKIVKKTEYKEIEKPLCWWQKTLMWIGGIFLLVLLLICGHKILKRFGRIK